MVHIVVKRASEKQSSVWLKTRENRELKQLRRPQRLLQKNNRFNDQNNSSARASRFLVHFFDVHCTTTTWNLLICRFMEDVNIRRRSFLFLNLNKILKNSTLGKVACIWHIERVQIDATKFERTQIHFFTNVFTAVVVVLAKVPKNCSKLLKIVPPAS